MRGRGLDTSHQDSLGLWRAVSKSGVGSLSRIVILLGVIFPLTIKVAHVL